MRLQDWAWGNTSCTYSLTKITALSAPGRISSCPELCIAIHLHINYIFINRHINPVAKSQGVWRVNTRLAGNWTQCLGWAEVLCQPHPLMTPEGPEGWHGKWSLIRGASQMNLDCEPWDTLTNISSVAKGNANLLFWAACKNKVPMVWPKQSSETLSYSNISKLVLFSLT